VVTNDRTNIWRGRTAFMEAMFEVVNFHREEEVSCCTETIFSKRIASTLLCNLVRGKHGTQGTKTKVKQN